MKQATQEFIARIQKALTKDHLDHIIEQGCQAPHCTHKHDEEPLFLNSRCHPEGKVQVFYDAKVGLVSVVCGVCEQLVADIVPYQIQAPLYKLTQDLPEAVLKAERLEDEGKDATGAYQHLMMMEDLVGHHHHPASLEGRLARCGALRAALKSGDTEVAQQLYQRYLEEPGADEALKKAMGEVIGKGKEAQ